MPAVERSRMKRHGRIGRAASGARNESAAPLGCNLDADQSALERNVCTVPIDIGIVRGQALLGTSQSIFGTLQIDLFGTFGGFGKNRYAIRKNLGKSANDSEMRGFLAAGIVKAEFAVPQFVEERCGPRWTAK